MAEERNYNEPAVDDLQPDADSVTVQIDGRIVWQAIGAIVLTGFVIWMVTLASSLVAMLAIAFFFSLALDPGVRWFVNHRGWRRGAATGAIYVGGITLYFAMLAAFALAPDPITAGIALVLTGIGGAGFAIMQPTLVFLATPPEMRSRVLGLLSVCIGLGPIGFIALGAVAEAVGAPRATAATGIAGLAAMAATYRFWRRI